MKNATCPNMTTPEWKLLVQKHGGIRTAALKEYYENNNEIPADIQKQVAINEGMESSEESYDGDIYTLAKAEAAKEAKKVIAVKLKKMAALAKSFPDLKKSRDALSEAYLAMQNAEHEEVLSRFILAAERLTANAESYMKKIREGNVKNPMEALKRLDDSLKSFDVLTTLKAEFFREDSRKKEFQKVASIVNRQQSLKVEYLQRARSAIAELWAPRFHRIQAEYREKAERAFLKGQAKELKAAGKTDAEIQQMKEEAINNYMMENATMIKLETEDRIDAMLVQTADIPSLIHWVVNPKDMGHDIISMAVESLDKADYDIRRKTIDKVREFEELNNAFIAAVGKKSNPKEQYAMFFNKDGVFINPKGMPKQYREFKADHQDKPAIWNFYEAMLATAEATDALLPEYAKLSGGLPQINKSSMERIYSNGVWTTIKESTIDNFKLRAEDTEYGNIEEQLGKDQSVTVGVSESGKERETIPIFYRAPVAESDRSYDLPSLFLLDYNNALNYRAKAETLVSLELLKDIVADSSILQVTAFKKLKKKREADSAEHTIKAGAASNLYKSLDGLIRNRIYGIQIEGDPAIAKKMQALGTWVSYLGLGVNVLSSGANFLQGASMSFIEATGSRTGLFGMGDKMRAIAKYDMDIANGKILGDIGERHPKSKTNLLMLHLNAASDFRALDSRFVDNNKGKKLMNFGYIMGLQNMGEHAVQSVVMYSVLNNIKVLGADGNYLDKNRKSTTDRSKAMSIDEAMVIHEGQLVFIPEAAASERTHDLGEDAIFQISQLIRRTNRDLYGNYDAQNKSEFQRTIVGSQVSKMRGWMVPGIQKRWRGLGNVVSKEDRKRNQEELDPHRRSYNQETGQFEEGTYVTTIRFLGGCLRELKELKLLTVSENWNNLLDKEKDNVIKAITELGLAIATYVAFMALAPEPGEEEDMTQLLAAYYTRRLYSELVTYANPLEWTRTTKTPAIVIGTIQDSIKFIMQGARDTAVVAFGGEAERYKTGRRAGELQVVRKMGKLVPIWKQLDRDVEESLQFMDSQ